MKKKAVVSAVVLSFYFLCMTKHMLAQTAIQIGNQTWMNENLDVDTFRNGDRIAQAETNREWEKASENKQPAWCYFKNKPENGKVYGKLYNWFAVSDPRGLAPEGWHVPSDSDWSSLIETLGDDDISGNKMKKLSGWIDDSKQTNESGFSALPGGARYLLTSRISFVYINSIGFWWSATQFDTLKAWSREIGFNGKVFRKVTEKDAGLSVRCMKD